MNKTIHSILSGILCIAIMFSGTGCHHEEATDTTTDDTVKSMASYYDEADKSITAANAEEELTKMMKEIDSDTD